MKYLMLLLALLLPALPAAAADASGQPVVLLHGLARSSTSMEPMARALRREGYAVCNVDYPSRGHGVAELARDHVAPQIARCFPGETRPLHYVTHSMGGILVRQLAATGEAGRVGRVVMLGPPNQGSEIVDLLGDSRIFSAINGPAGRQLGTKPDSLPNRLGPVDFDLGVIAGDRSINWINSLLIAGADDGKVSVERTKVTGMKAHHVIHATHPYLMKNSRAIRETVHFLREGRFSPAKP